MIRTKFPNNDSNEQLIKKIASSISMTQLQAQRCRQRLFQFVKHFWEEAGIHETPVWNWHIKLLCKQLEQIAYRVAAGEDNKYDLDVNIPPGTTKSLLFTVFFPAWCWSNWPWMKFIKLSYSAPLSLEHAETCREIIRSDKYQIFFPDLRIKRDKDQKSNFKIKYLDPQRSFWRDGGNLFSTSIKGTVTGFHAHIILIDDPVDPFKSFSDVELESVNTWIKNVLPTRKINKKVTPTIMIMQRTHPRDPSGQNVTLQKKGLKLKRIVLPGYLSNKKKRKLVKPKRYLKYYDQNKGFLDPQRLDLVVLKELELKLGQYGYRAQIDQDPKMPGGGMFKTEEFENYIDAASFNWRANFVKAVRYWDKAGTTDGGKRTAGVKMAELTPLGDVPRFVIMDVTKGQWAATKREKVIEQVSEEDGTDMVQYIEQEPGSGGKESAEATIARLAKLNIACEADRPTGDKFYRADPFSVAWNRGQVYLVKAAWNQEFLDELADFSPSAYFKDQVDAAAAAYNKLAGGSRAGTW